MDKTRSADFLARPHQRRTPEWKAELLKDIRTAAQTGQVVLGIVSAASGDAFLVTIILELEERSCSEKLWLSHMGYLLLLFSAFLPWMNLFS